MRRCCVSKARPPARLAALEEEGDGRRQANATSVAALRQQLGELRVKELRARAKTEGVDEDALEDTTDSDDPKQAVIELLLRHLRPASGAQDAQDAHAALRSELEGLRVKELRARAKQAGVDEDALEDTTDSGDPKQAVIELLLRHLRPSGAQ
eukprot:COSAG06_NODE_4516_length_4188_cov_1.828320_5_plen_152_part_01